MQQDNTPRYIVQGINQKRKTPNDTRNEKRDPQRCQRRRLSPLPGFQSMGGEELRLSLLQGHLSVLDCRTRRRPWKNILDPTRRILPPKTGRFCDQIIEVSGYRVQKPIMMTEMPFWRTDRGRRGKLNNGESEIVGRLIDGSMDRWI